MGNKNAEKEARRIDVELKAVMAEPANQVCADCGSPKPRFASITLAIFLCNRCYGIHRAVGAHITRTKCVGLDKWSSEDVNRMRFIGNAVASAYWEQDLPEGIRRPDAESSDYEVEKWIRGKYEKRLFCPKDLPPPSVPPTPLQATKVSQGSTSKIVAPPPSVPQDTDWRPFG